MKNRVGWYFRAKRQARGLSVEALAARLDCQNLRKATRRIVRLELDGQCPETLLVRIADALAVDYATVLELAERDMSQRER